jgi:hypothetical protein
MVFEPRYYGPDEVTPDLFVWRIGTEETTSILLSDEEYRSLAVTTALLSAACPADVAGF